MTGSLRRPATVVWVTIVTFTVVSGNLGEGRLSRGVATTAVLGIAMAKAALIGFYFMDLRHGPRLLRHVFGAWILLVGFALTGLYLSGG